MHGVLACSTGIVCRLLPSQGKTPSRCGLPAKHIALPAYTHACSSTPYVHALSAALRPAAAPKHAHRQRYRHRYRSSNAHLRAHHPARSRDGLHVPGPAYTVHVSSLSVYLHSRTMTRGPALRPLTPMRSMYCGRCRLLSGSTAASAVYTGLRCCHISRSASTSLQTREQRAAGRKTVVPLSHGMHVTGGAHPHAWYGSTVRLPALQRTHLAKQCTAVQLYGMERVAKTASMERGCACNLQLRLGADQGALVLTCWGAPATHRPSA